MRHYLRLMGAFMRAALQQEMAFRSNFAINLLNTVLSLVAGLSGMAILFSQVQTVQGWTYPQALALLGVYLLLGALRNLCIGPSMELLGGLYGEVMRGGFDFALLKPVHTQFLVSFRNWRLWSLVDLLLSLVVLGAALAQIGGPLGPLRLVTFLLALSISLVIMYAFLLILASAIFWYRGTSFLMIFDSLIQLGRYPVGIYPGWLRLLLLWVVPVGFITTVPAQALAGQLSAATLVGGAALAAALFLVASTFFRVSLRRYASASS
jgi:ABC-2 type transport system permease protein